MVKTGFRGERKRILTPSLSQGEGECSDGKRESKNGKSCLTGRIGEGDIYGMDFLLSGER